MKVLETYLTLTIILFLHFTVEETEAQKLICQGHGAALGRRAVKSES